MRQDVPPKYRGIVQTLVTVAREEGFWSLWKGNGANCIRIAPNYACKFAFNDFYRDMVRVPGQPLTFNQMMVAGTCAGLTQIVLTYPLELVRTRLSLSTEFSTSANKEPYKGIIDCFRRTVRNEGWTALYKGIGPTFLSGAPYTGLQMTFYEIFKRQLSPLGHSAISSLVSGALAGIVSQTLTYPGDTIRRRMQANGLEGLPRIYKNSWDCLIKIVRIEGALALFSGCFANIVRAVPGTAIQFWSYEGIKRLLGVEPIGS